jgi:SecD/SecF fusion protein
MNSSRHSRLTVFALAAAAFVALPWSACAPQPKGPVLIYEVDSKGAADGAAPDMERAARAVLARVSLGGNLAQVAAEGDRRIRVSLIRNDVGDMKRVEQLLARTGALEFRVLANQRDDEELIRRALADSSQGQVLDSKGKLLAWWVPGKAGTEQTLAHYNDIARRTRKHGQRETMEILVVKDNYDLTGAYLTHAGAGTDRQGRPCIYITFNKLGGELFAELTGQHLPDRTTGFTYKLGIILNGEITSAPGIQGVTGDRAEITGSFTRQEVADLANVLNAGTIPRLRLVEKKAR